MTQKMKVEVKETETQKKDDNNDDLICWALAVGLGICLLALVILPGILIRHRVSREGPKFFTEQLGKALNDSPTTIWLTDE